MTDVFKNLQPFGDIDADSTTYHPLQWVNPRKRIKPHLPMRERAAMHDRRVDLEQDLKITTADYIWQHVRGEWVLTAGNKIYVTGENKKEHLQAYKSPTEAFRYKSYGAGDCKSYKVSHIGSKGTGSTPDENTLTEIEDIKLEIELPPCNVNWQGDGGTIFGSPQIIGWG